MLMTLVASLKEEVRQDEAHPAARTLKNAVEKAGQIIFRELRTKPVTLNVILKMLLFPC